MSLDDYKIEETSKHASVLDGLCPRLCGECLTVAGGIALTLISGDEVADDRLTNADNAHILAVLRWRLCDRCKQVLDQIETTTTSNSKGREINGFEGRCSVIHDVNGERAVVTGPTTNVGGN